MSIDSKLDELLSEVAKIKTEVAFQTEDIKELKTKLEPVFEHVNGMKFLAKCLAGALGVGTLVLGILSLVMKH